MRRVGIIGTGLIGGSLGLALRRSGLEVHGFDADAERLSSSVDRGVIDNAASSVAAACAGMDAVIVALPVSEVAGAVCAALREGAVYVTDVASVKAPVMAAVQQEMGASASRFIGGHPMAGSEQEGLAGADADLFVGATWVLTPTTDSDPEAFAQVRELVARTGAEVLAVDPERHDTLVAVVSHVPHLAATTLMHVAAGSSSEERATLLRLAAGGFRDMTRIAAGHPGIWPDICVTNREAIVNTLDRYVEELQHVRTLVAAEARLELMSFFEQARAERRSLPIGAPAAGGTVELRIPVLDRPGVLAEVTTLVGEHGANILDLEIAHSSEGAGGVVVMVIAASGADEVVTALAARGYRLACSEIT